MTEGMAIDESRYVKYTVTQVFYCTLICIQLTVTMNSISRRGHA